MTPAHTDSPLRRSEVGIFREANHQNVTINDDEEERRQARRRTILQSTASDTGTFEENETLKKCLEIYNGNKLSRDNAWSMSLIDTLSTLLDRHHKSLNNFKVAGSSLEASSKVYGLRVDSIHTDVLRMSAGLNAQKFSDKQRAGAIVDDDDDDNNENASADPNASKADANNADASPQPAPKKQKRQRRIVSTITKNKETLNARLDTVPLQDPVFGKLNTIVGSINSSNRLMNNILLTTDSELRLRLNFPFWDASELEKCDFTAAADNLDSLSCEESELAPCDRLFKFQGYEELQLRSTHGGYIISDTPDPIADEKELHRISMDSGGAGDGFADADAGPFLNANEMSMAFDINAECEPLPALSEQAPMLDIEYGEFDALSREERTAINNCRGLRKTALLIEDLRPVDASSQLEYSYRPLDKISQFWAGPSHWKFKRGRASRASVINGGQSLGQQTIEKRPSARSLNQRAKRAAAALAKERLKHINFLEAHDELFIKLDDKYKARKANIQKKWDQRKLKLPTDLQIDSSMFYTFAYSPMLPVEATCEERKGMHSLHTDDELPLDGVMPTEDHFGDDEHVSLGCDNNMNISSMSANGMMAESGADDAMGIASESEGGEGDNIGNNTVLEIATDFEGAPSQVTKIIVPFAKRAKVIDMKSLKRCCTQLLNKQLKRHINDSQIPVHPIIQEETYSGGMASFNEIYNHLPDLLTPNMAEAITPSVAFYSMLHLSNDFNLRLIPQEDLEDFKIRQVML